MPQLRRLTSITLALGLASAAHAQAGQVAIVLETSLGSIEALVDSARAPVTAANFLRYVDAHAYDGGRFHRTVRLENQPDNVVKIEVIQGGISREKAFAGYPPIPLERTSVTGVLHVDGALSMARGGPNTATSDFFIAIGARHELDFGGKRNADGQGFAAFGRVTKGMDVVRRIQASAAQQQALTPPVVIMRVSRKG